MGCKPVGEMMHMQGIINEEWAMLSATLVWKTEGVICDTDFNMRWFHWGGDKLVGPWMESSVSWNRTRRRHSKSKQYNKTYRGTEEYCMSKEQ